MARGLKAWTDKLRKTEMPVLGEVIEELNEITGSEDAEVNQLAEVILRDPNLTSQVLRIANSVHYNYSPVPINTVSRAIVLIGLKGVRAICISLLVLERLLGDQPKERLLKLVAQAFHAATQARSLAVAVNDKAAEEVFIAGLLFNLGEMAFWACKSVRDEHPGLASDDPQVRRAAMEEVLGTSFKAITRELAVYWKLGDTLEQALFPKADVPPKVAAVILGERISRAANYGWASPQVKKVLREVMAYTGKDAKEALLLVKKGADQAAEVASHYGAGQVCPLIPSSSKREDTPVRLEKSRVLKADPSVQLSILRELSSSSPNKVDVNTMFQMVLEGMHRGIGLERVVFAFIEKHKLKARYVLGEGAEQWRNNFLLDIGPYSENLFTLAITEGGSRWLNREFIESSRHLYDNEIVRVVGRFPALVGTVQLDSRKIGLFYADRWTFGGELNGEHFDSFKHFVSQAQSCLNQLRHAS